MKIKLESRSIRASVAGLKYRTQAFINGRYVDSASGKTFVSINPATGKPLADIASCDAVDAGAAVLPPSRPTAVASGVALSSRMVPPGIAVHRPAARFRVP